MGKVSKNRFVEKLDCTGVKQHPVSLLVAVGLDHSIAEAAPQNVHSFMKGVEGVVRDGQQTGRRVIHVSQLSCLCSRSGSKTAERNGGRLKH